MNNLVKKLSIAAVATATIASASYAYAATYFEEWVYYATSAKTTIVGERINRCDGTPYITGTVTAHKRLMNRESCGIYYPHN
jgi:hypothetical protein